MPLFFYTQLPSCTFRSCSHLCVSGVFTYFYSQLWDVAIWVWPFTSFQTWSVVHQNHSCAIPLPRLPLVALVTVSPSVAKPAPPPHTHHHHHPVSQLSAVHWLQYCSCRRGQFVQEQDRVTGRDPQASAAHDPARSSSLARKQPVAFWPRGPSTRPLLIVP